VKRYQEVVDVLERLLDVLSGLRSIREKIPKREAVVAVRGQRKDLVSHHRSARSIMHYDFAPKISSICISFYAAEHAFRSRQPLPQFLPSSRIALDALVSGITKTVHKECEADPHALGFSLVYAFAESEALDELVDHQEKLLNLCRQLFGISSWVGMTEATGTLFGPTFA